MKHFRHTFFSILFLALLQQLSIAQSLVPDLGEVFKDDAVSRVDITLPADSLAALYTPGEEWRNYHYHASFIFNNGHVIDTLENVGFRFRGNTSRTADKKSFKISFNTYEAGRKYHGLEKMNLNGEHNDPSIMRSKICWDILREMGLVGSRTNYVQLYINNDYYGLYINIEHIDEEFVESRFGNKDGNLYKCLWPADLDYKGSNPELYKEVTGSRRTYDLRTNTEIDDYTDLAHFIDILNNTATNELACALESVFNVDAYLKYLAFDIATGNWDGPIYNKNNFYLYHNTSTEKFEYIPYDLDNTLGIDWLGRNWGTRNIYNWAKSDEPRPLYDRLMAVEEYKNRFSYYMSELQTAIFNEDQLNPRIDELKAMINIPVILDPYRPLDYGFTFQDFLASFTVSLNEFHVAYGLKPYISTRHDVTSNQLDVNNIHPIIGTIRDNRPSQGQLISITANIMDDDQINTTQLCYTINQEPAQNCVPLYDDGLHNDELSNDGIYGAIIPAIEGATSLQYFVDVSDNMGLQSRQPRCGTREFTISTNQYQLYINELMASNSTLPDEAGEFDDWLELYHDGPEPLYLGDKFLSDNESLPSKWLMPDISIQPGEHLLFWADNDEEQGEMHTNFKLSATGEFIGIFDSEVNDFALIDGHHFDVQQPNIPIGRIPDGTGPFQEVEATPAAMNMVLVLATESASIIVPTINTYPNPLKEDLSVEIISEVSQQWTARLYSSLGYVLLERKLNNGLNTMSLRPLNLTPGVYFLQLLSEDNTLRTMKVLMIE